MRMRFSDLRPAEKAEHIWIYYKFHILGGAILVLLVVYFLSTILGRVPSALNVEVVSGNILPGSTAAWQQQATAALVPAGKRETVQIASLPVTGALSNPQNGNTLMALTAMIAARNVDVMMVDESSFLTLRREGFFENLRQTGLPASFLDRHSYPSAAGQTAGEPVYGLELPRSLATRRGIQAFGNNVVAIVRNAPNTGAAARFLAWLWR